VKVQNVPLKTGPRVRYDTACRLATLALLSVTIRISAIFSYRYLTNQLVTFGQRGCVVPFLKMPYTVHGRIAIVEAYVRTKSFKETCEIFAEKFPNVNIPAKSNILLG
jgi:hypothetical protein